MVLNRDESAQMCLSTDTKPQPKYNGAILHVVDEGSDGWYRYYTANFDIDEYDEAKWFSQS